jgi:hypothetical protein
MQTAQAIEARRDWDSDSRMLNTTDAIQMLHSYLRSYSPRKALSLLESCRDKHGHPGEIDTVIQAAIMGLRSGLALPQPERDSN